MLNLSLVTCRRIAFDHGAPIARADSRSSGKPVANSCSGARGGAEKTFV